MTNHLNDRRNALSELDGWMVNTLSRGLMLHLISNERIIVNTLRSLIMAMNGVKSVFQAKQSPESVASVSIIVSLFLDFFVNLLIPVFD